MMADLPPDVRAEVQRILDAEARRLLAEQLHGDAPRAATGDDYDAPDGRADQRPARIERETLPVGRRVDRDRGRRAA